MYTTLQLHYPKSVLYKSKVMTFKDKGYHCSTLPINVASDYNWSRHPMDIYVMPFLNSLMPEIIIFKTMHTAMKYISLHCLNCNKYWKWLQLEIYGHLMEYLGLLKTIYVEKNYNYDNGHWAPLEYSVLILWSHIFLLKLTMIEYRDTIGHPCSTLLAIRLATYICK